MCGRARKKGLATRDYRKMVRLERMLDYRGFTVFCFSVFLATRRDGDHRRDEGRRGEESKERSSRRVDHGGRDRSRSRSRDRSRRYSPSGRRHSDRSHDNPHDDRRPSRYSLDGRGDGRRDSHRSRDSRRTPDRREARHSPSHRQNTKRTPDRDRYSPDRKRDSRHGPDSRRDNRHNPDNRWDAKHNPDNRWDARHDPDKNMHDQTENRREGRWEGSKCWMDKERGFSERQNSFQDFSNDSRHQQSTKEIGKDSSNRWEFQLRSDRMDRSRDITSRREFPQNNRDRDDREDRDFKRMNGSWGRGGRDYERRLPDNWRVGRVTTGRRGGQYRGAGRFGSRRGQMGRGMTEDPSVIPTGGYYFEVSYVHLYICTCTYVCIVSILL